MCCVENDFIASEIALERGSGGRCQGVGGAWL